jgi:hypothetical protein
LSRSTPKTAVAHGFAPLSPPSLDGLLPVAALSTAPTSQPAVACSLAASARDKAVEQAAARRPEALNEGLAAILANRAHLHLLASKRTPARPNPVAKAVDAVLLMRKR